MLLAGLPATPVQLVHACHQFGYEVVVPASWGDELVAQAVLEDLRERDRDPVIQCTCPLVSDRLLSNGQHLAPSMLQTASPPVAAARYARAAFSPRPLHITYLGACPGARHDVIDQRHMPDEFLNLLDERGIVLADMPAVFDSVLPPDRRRFFSLPGGCPSQEALWQATDGRMLRELTQPTFSTDLAQTLVWREYVMVDVAPSLGCACAGSTGRLGARCGRVAVMSLEPPRAEQSVVVYRPDFVTPETELPKPVEVENGKTPVPFVPSAASKSESEPRWTPAEEPSAEVVAARPRRVTPSRLPRAYLAKRRYSTPVYAIPQREEEPVRDVEAPQPSAEPPNDAEITRAIAVHVEPEAQPVLTESPTSDAQDVTAPAMDYSLAALMNEATVAQQPQATTAVADVGVEEHVASEDAMHELPSATPEAPLLEEDEWTESISPAPNEESEAQAPRSEELEAPTPPSEEFEAAAPPSEESAAPQEARAQPLRVEVEIFEEIEPPELPEPPEPPEPPRPEVVFPSSIRRETQIKPAEPVPEIVTRPVRRWADLLIALWLVLVASAVIATLFWRR